jgi:WD40 repeat protein
MARDSAGYDLFVSHSRRLDARIAEALQRGIESFAKPWWRPRSLRVFRDVSSLSANPDLWGSIETALARTRFLVLLASPEAAASPWVRRELEWWLQHRGPHTLFFAVTAGRVPWSEANRVDWPIPSCIPEYVLSYYATAPRWVDLRALRSDQQISRQNPALLDAIADIGAAVRGVDKDQLVGEHIRQHRRVVRTASVAVALLTLLTVATVIASFLFAGQRNAARQQATIATAKQFAATAQAEAQQRIDQAMLLAAKAYRMDPGPDTLSAAFATALASPKLTYVAHAGAAISALAARPDGSAVLTGWNDGTIASFNPSTTRWTRLAKLPHGIVDLASSRDGHTVVATDGYVVDALQVGQAPRQLGTSRHPDLYAVAVSSDGATAAYESATFTSSTLTATSTDGEWQVSQILRNASFTHISLSAGYLFGFDGAYGNWAKMSLSDLRVLATLRPGFGVHDYASAMSADGSAITYTNSAPQIPIWDTAVSRQGAPNPQNFQANPTRWGRGPGVDPQAMALSPDGKRLAIADSGTIYVTDPASDTNNTSQVAQLTGLSEQSISHIVFLDDIHLAATSGSTLTLYDLTQVSPLTISQPGQVTAACTACPGSAVFPSPDGGKVAFMDGAGPVTSLVIHDMRTGREVSYTEHSAASSATLGPPVWSPNGPFLLIPQAADGSVDVLSAATLKRVRTWPASHHAGTIVSSRFVNGGRQFVTVAKDGRVTVRDGSTGDILRLTAPTQPIGEDIGAEPQWASVNSTGTRLTLLNLKGVFSVDLARGTATRLPMQSEWAELLGSSVTEHGIQYATSVAYAGDTLRISGYQVGGTNWVNIYRNDGTTLVRRVTLSEGVLEDPVASESGQLVAFQANSGAVTLLDAATDKQIGSFPLTASVEGFKTGLAFTATGKYLFTVTDSADTGPGTVERWSLDPTAITDRLCYLAGRTLTIQEWHQLAGGRAADTACP